MVPLGAYSTGVTMKAAMRLGLVLAAVVLLASPAVADAQGQNEATNAAVVTVPTIVEVPFTWTTNTDKTITITRYTGGGETVAIPNTVNGLPVTSIGKQAFSLCTNLTKVTISVGVTNIGSHAFACCDGLTNVTMPEGVANIGSAAFLGCTRLGNVMIPNGVTSIGESSFACCGLTNVTIPDCVTNIGKGAFAFCRKLTDVAIPVRVASIGWAAFCGCTNLTSITVDAKNPIYASIGGVLFDKNQTTLIQCPWGRVGSYSIPDGVANIADHAFWDRNGLTNIMIGTSITNIGNTVFGLCFRLTGVYFKGNAPSLGKDVFDGATNATVYYLPGTTDWSPTFGDRPTAVWKPEGGAATN